MLSNSSRKRRREIIVRKGLREDQTSHPQKDTSDKETETEDPLTVGVSVWVDGYQFFSRTAVSTTASFSKAAALDSAFIKAAS